MTGSMSDISESELKLIIGFSQLAEWFYILQISVCVWGGGVHHTVNTWQSPIQVLPKAPNIA